MGDIQYNIEFCDSDDDLLGITDTYVPIRTYNNYNTIITPILSSDNTILDINSMKYFVPITFDSIQLKRNNCSVTTNTQNTNTILSDNKCIDDSLSKIITHEETKIQKYQRMREISGVIGFVVNVHDATNFDIDFDMPTDLHERYKDVISNHYTYKDVGTNFFETPNNIDIVTSKIGTTYRCRLRGIGINQLPQHIHTWKTNQMCVDVKQLIDRTDGWVICTLSDIDVYKRLLVDITINTCNGPIDLRSYLLSKMKSEDNPIFYHYSTKKDFIYKP